MKKMVCAALALAGAGVIFADEPPQAPSEAAGKADAVVPAVAVAAKSADTSDKRIMGVLPNYRTADGTLPFSRISPKYKLTIAAKDSFDWPNYIIGGVFGGLYQAENQHPSFGQGVAGFARRYGTSYADQVIGNMLTEGIMPILMHEDPRYFRMVHGNVWKRLGYSLTRTLITKTDSGKTTVNFAEIVGNTMGGTISNLYYPDEHGGRETAIRAAAQIATDSLSNVLKEFWPDIKRRMHKNDPLVTNGSH